MSMRLGEVYVDLVVAKLQAGIPARIAAINAEKQDGIVMLAPSDESYITSGIETLPRYPALVIAEGPSQFALEGNQSLMASPLIGVYCWDEDVNRQNLGRRLQRLARAVTECIFFDDPPQQLDSNAFRIEPTRTIPGRVFQPDQSDTWCSYYIVEFAATALEG